MAGVLYDANNVAVGEAYLYLQPWDSETPVPVIADTVALFDVAAWEAAGWSVAGATHEGFKANVETSTTTITIEEQAIPVDERVESKGVAFEAALAEDTLESISLSWGGSDITVTAAGASQPAKRTMVLTDTIKYWVAALEMRNVHGLSRRIHVGKASIVGSGETSFRRSADKRTYPVRVSSICLPSQIQIIDITAPATS